MVVDARVVVGAAVVVVAPWTTQARMWLIWCTEEEATWPAPLPKPVNSSDVGPVLIATSINRPPLRPATVKSATNFSGRFQSLTVMLTPG